MHFLAFLRPCQSHCCFTVPPFQNFRAPWARPGLLKTGKEILGKRLLNSSPLFHSTFDEPRQRILTNRYEQGNILPFNVITCLLSSNSFILTRVVFFLTSVFVLFCEECAHVVLPGLRLAASSGPGLQMYASSPGPVVILLLLLLLFLYHSPHPPQCLGIKPRAGALCT